MASLSTSRVSASSVDLLGRAGRWLGRAAAGLLIGLVKLYQRTLSPVLPVVLGPTCGCRFHPTCSHYAIEALRVHGVLRGTALTIWRLLKCTPLHPGGFDAVPVPRPRRTCRRVDSVSSSSRPRTPTLTLS